MRGDFSAWNKDRSHNFRGTLHQQGRVLLDRDWNAQTEIMGEWQETAARDAFGAGVAAVPAEEPLSFKVVKAEVSGGQVKVSLNKGRVWADGLLVELPADAVRTATYLGPPTQAAPAPDAVPSVGDRDAVILETWLEELSPFQNPDLLIEPALGGVDTTERVQTAFQFRLYRKADGDTCDSIIGKLRDDFSVKGKLRVELKPTNVKDGDCPLVESGGFTGFEHRLYRIEMADTDKPALQAYFKWSHFNGGLVGTGDFDAATRKVTIHGNKNAIVYSGSNNFYLEALDYVTTFGCWKVVYGAKTTLAADGTLSLPDPAAIPGDIYKGSIPAAPSKGKRFFRLWNGIERVANFTAKKDLPDNLGILIQFEPEGPGKYTPSDFWTFEARVDPDINLVSPQNKLVDNLPPQGIFYHRVPLAEVHWTSNTVTGDGIEDCRRPFQPLTKLKTCCTYRVGDGIHSHGDFKKVQAAINALPKTGGEVCILPGLYEENIVLKAPHNRGVILKGCGRRTLIKAVKDDPAIYVEYGQGITIESLGVEAHEEGIGIFLEGEEMTADGKEKDKYLKDIVLSQLFVSAAKNNAIKSHTAQSLTLSNSVVRIKDVQTRKPAVYLEGDDMLIERNEIRVLPNRFPSEEEALTNDPALFIPAREAAGGLQIGGGSERVRILNNLIINGRGNGISLGRIDLMKDGKEVPGRDPFEPKDQQEDPCRPDPGHIDDGEGNEEGYVAIAGPPLYDILIKFNRIFNMGRNGIGVAAFFSMGEEMDLSDIKGLDKVAVKGVIMVSKLVISENWIERCMNISPQAIPEKMSHLMGYGGIALAVCENLVIQDNFIVDNCSDCLDPICGIYTLAAIGLEISRNEITEHLPQNYDEVNPGNVKIGPRGGIWVFIAVGQMDALAGSSYGKAEKAGVFRQSSGSHAAKIHENVVSTPLGRSLTLMILGDASVVGNRFTSFGIQPVDIIKLFMSIFFGKKLSMSIFLQVLGLMAGNVLILDLGSFLMVREYKRLARKSKQTATEPEAGAAAEGPAAPTGNSENFTTVSNVSNQAMGRVAAWVIKGGFILFSNNQCKLNPQAKEISIALSSVLIAGLADVGFLNNQASCSIPRSLLFANAALAGGTLRATGNWLKETLGHVGVSAMTFGALNVTADNESVHCLFIWGALFLDRFNLVLGALAMGVFGSITEAAGDAQEGLCKKEKGLARIGVQMLKTIMSEQDGRVGTNDLGAWGIKVKTRGGG